MKSLTLILLSLLFVSCASPDRRVASESDREALYALEEKGDFGPSYRN